MAVKLSPIWSGTQFLNSAGQPLSGGKINTYLAGTTTAQATFTDATGSVQNANPIILDSAGRYSSQIWLTAGVNYKFVLTDSNNNTILTEDNLSGINDTTSGVTSEWLPQSTPTFVSGTSFTVTGNQTSTFQVGMRVKATINAGFIYGTIATSVFTSLTTITLNNDSGSLDATLSAVSVGLLGETNPSVPAILLYNVVAFHAHRSTNQTSGNTVIFDTVDNQTGGTNYSNSTGVFTAPFTGWYRFDSSNEFSNGSGGGLTTVMNLNIGAVTVAASSVPNTLPTGQVAILTTNSTVFLNASNTVSIVSSTTLTATYQILGGGGAGSTTSFSGCLLQRTA